jgi:hypothetical protein
MSVPVPYRSDVYVCSKSCWLCLTVVYWLLECNKVPSWIENPRVRYNNFPGLILCRNHIHWILDSFLLVYIDTMPNSFLVSSFLTISSFAHHFIDLRNFIPATSILVLSLLFTAHSSLIYTSTDAAMVVQNSVLDFVHRLMFLKTHRLGKWIWKVQRLSLALTRRSNRVGDPLLFYVRTETDPVSEKLCFRNIRRWKKSKNMTPPSAVHHRQNPLE